MPQYELEDRKGERTLIEISQKEFAALERSEEDEIKYKGKWFTPLLFAAGGSAPCWGGSGFRSDAMGVNPTQIKEQMAADKRNGVTGVTYDRKTGQAVYDSRDSVIRHRKAYGFHPKNSYGGRL